MLVIVSSTFQHFCKGAISNRADPELKRRGCTLKVQDQKGGEVTNSCLSPTCIKVDKIFYSLIVNLVCTAFHVIALLE